MGREKDQIRSHREEELHKPWLEPAKIRAIISAWLDYIWLEDLTNAKVKAGNSSNPLIWDKNVSLVGDQLIIDKTLFKTIKQNFKTYQQQEKPEEFPIAVAFPMIFQLEDNRRQFRPLFTIDISSILKGNYRSRGWDLNQFEFFPVLPNLMDLYGIEEEEAETLVTREGLRVFLETTFNRTFSTLSDFVQLIELPSKPLRAKPLPYLLRFDFVPYNYNLKKDLEKIQQQQDWHWAVPFHPAYEYLLGKPEPSRHNITVHIVDPI